MKMKKCILIPARMNSTRLPRKPLQLIQGKAMIQWVYENMRELPKEDFDVFVVTDSEEIGNVIEEIKGKVLMVTDDVPTGTERIAIAYKRLLKSARDCYSLVINVQGDEPLLRAKLVEDLAAFHEKSFFDITTLYKIKMGDREAFYNSSTVKIALQESNGTCHYFSRSPIPYYQHKMDQDFSMKWFQHVGVYSYLPQVLEKFVTLPQSPLELAESLEQLRAIENGISIGAKMVDGKWEIRGVDTHEDLEKVSQILKLIKLS